MTFILYLNTTAKQGEKWTWVFLQSSFTASLSAHECKMAAATAAQLRVPILKCSAYKRSWNSHKLQNPTSDKWKRTKSGHGGSAYLLPLYCIFHLRIWSHHAGIILPPGEVGRGREDLGSQGDGAPVCLDTAPCFLRGEAKNFSPGWSCKWHFVRHR